jgi:hypothetical protein
MMLSVDVTDEGNGEDLTLAFTFSGDAEGVALAGLLMDLARPMALSGGRLAIEMGAHVAYFQSLELGLRKWGAALGEDATPSNGEDKSGDMT